MLSSWGIRPNPLWSLGKDTYAFLKQFFELIRRFAFPFAIWMLFTYKETIGYLTGTRSEEKPRKKRKNRMDHEDSSKQNCHDELYPDKIRNGCLSS